MGGAVRPGGLDTEAGEARWPAVSVDAGLAVVAWSQTAPSGIHQLRARSGDVEWLKQHGKVYAAVEAA